MSIEIIGKQIASMRKEKGIKQEELAKYVGVSTQAVSKWENGGVPDAELLPRIADFFQVSIDFLFGRNITEYVDFKTVLAQNIINSPEEQKLKIVFDYCWDMERAVFGHLPVEGSIEEYEKRFGRQEQIYSSILTDYGFTRMGLANRLQYFLLVPEIENTDIAIFEGIDYPEFFKDFSDKDLFEACVFLHKRDNKHAFTEKLLVNHLKIDTEKAIGILGVLGNYGLLNKTQIEMDDEIHTIYNFRPSPSFIAFLIFAREMIKVPNNFCYYNCARNNPYLK